MKISQFYGNNCTLCEQMNCATNEFSHQLWIDKILDIDLYESVTDFNYFKIDVKNLNNIEFSGIRHFNCEKFQILCNKYRKDLWIRFLSPAQCFIRAINWITFN